MEKRERGAEVDRSGERSCKEYRGYEFKLGAFSFSPIYYDEGGASANLIFVV